MTCSRGDPADHVAAEDLRTGSTYRPWGALAAEGRTEDAARERDLARARVLRFAEGLEPDDRANWLAVNVVAETLALEQRVE